MDGYQHIQKPLSTLPPPPPPPQQNINHRMLYYGIVVLATATIVLAIYHLIIVRWCTIQYQRHLQQQQLSHRRTDDTNTPNNTPSSVVCLISSFKYSKNQQVEYNDTECSVCLSVFEEGEEVKKLPMCDHRFHASCIDMWLYSHIHCPLCRAPVVAPPPGSSSV